jgi:anaerobic selenocysteine-containing dehydrogenase
MQHFRTACPLDCPDACTIDATVVDGVVTKLDGTRDNPFTQGFLCSKVRRFPHHVYGPERLRHPERRTGRKGDGVFERISWDDALDLLARELDSVRQRSGGEAILPLCYGGSNGLFTQGAADARLFARLGASRLQRTVCAAATGAAATALYGKMPGVALEDYEHAALIVLWGVNPSATGIHLVPIIEAARARGARLVVVDPRRTPLAAKADLHLAVRPGADLPVALAVARWLFEHGRADLDFLARATTGWERLRERAARWTPERAAAAAGVAAADVERFAALYADASPAVIRCGWGLERNRNGGSAVASVLALPAVAGKFGVRAGGYTLSNSGAWRDLRGDRAAGAAAPPSRLVNMNRVGALLNGGADPPIELLFVYNNNPLQTLPRQEEVRRGLAREDLFTVVFEQVRTDTARWADLLLPATTFLEHDDLAVSYGAMRVNRVRPVIAPVGEARPNQTVFAELVRRLGLEQPGDAIEPSALEAALFSDLPAAGAAVARDGAALPACGPRPIQLVDVLPATPDGKICLFPPSLDAEAPAGLYGFQPDPGTSDFPLALISPATSRTVSSTFGQLHRQQVPLAMHPDDAAARGLAGGEEVRVWNRLGEVRCRVALDRGLRPGVVLLPKGLWSHHTANGATANALAPDTLTDLGGGACFNDARVEVAAVLA